MVNPSKTQEYFESKVIHKHGGIIDLKKLWKAEEDKELDRKTNRGICENPRNLKSERITVRVRFTNDIADCGQSDYEPNEILIRPKLASNQQGASSFTRYSFFQ
jgi:hypothetical protein